MPADAPGPPAPTSAPIPGPGGAAAAKPGGAAAAGLVRAALVLAGLVAVGLALRAAPRLDAGVLDRMVVGHGVRGAALYVALAGLGCAVGLPRQAAAFAAGYAFAPSLGFWGAAVLALAAQMLGCAADLAWARAAARAWVARRLPARLRRLEARIAARPFASTLTLRLLPVGNNLALNLLAGVSAVRALPFLAASAIGYLPQTVVCVLLGSGTQLGRGTEIGIAAGLFAASAALGVWLLRAPPGRALSATT